MDVGIADLGSLDRQCDDIAEDKVLSCASGEKIADDSFCSGGSISIAEVGDVGSGTEFVGREEIELELDESQISRGRPSLGLCISLN